MTKMMFRTDGPSTAASTMASGRNGITRNQSVMPHQDGVEPAAEEAGGDARRPSRSRSSSTRRREPDEQADPRAPDELGQHAAAEVVGAERAELGSGGAHAGLLDRR